VIPWVVAGELRATLLDYLRSTWSIADAGVEAALFAFLAGSSGLFQGPYLRLGLPFAAAPLDVPIPLDVVPPYPPHLHQLQAWQRLSSRGQTPQATLITTGTGSGKTECFLYPILDHASRERSAGKGGIKAIILYPMNALASDQAQRFAETIDADERLRGRLRVGLFIGGKGQHREMGRDHVVDDNDRLRANPPDILLTNYRMLDLLLQRRPRRRRSGSTTSLTHSATSSSTSSTPTTARRAPTSHASFAASASASGAPKRSAPSARAPPSAAAATHARSCSASRALCSTRNSPTKRSLARRASSRAICSRARALRRRIRRNQAPGPRPATPPRPT
jgi:hypothetical protein